MNASYRAHILKSNVFLTSSTCWNVVAFVDSVAYADWKTDPYQRILRTASSWAPEKFLQGGPLMDFSKIFLGGQKWLNLIFPLETKKTTFLLKFSKSKGWLSPPFWRPWASCVTHSADQAVTSSSARAGQSMAWQVVFPCPPERGCLRIKRHEGAPWKRLFKLSSITCFDQLESRVHRRHHGKDMMKDKFSFYKMLWQTFSNWDVENCVFLHSSLARAISVATLIPINIIFTIFEADIYQQF